MPRQMPGYSAHQEQQAAARRARDAEIREQQEKEKQEKEKQEKLKQAAKQVHAKKIDSMVGGAPLPIFLRNFFTIQTAMFIAGSMAWVIGQCKDKHGDRFWVAGQMYENVSYGQAIKNAYLLDDWRHGNHGVFQGLMGMLSIIISLVLAGKSVKTARKEAEETLKQLEQLKDYGVDMPQLIKDLTPSIKKMLASLSKVDRGYFDNLAAGGLEKADYETCVAIVSGYLKAHPKEYNKVIAIIDEATLPPEIVKKYGRGNTVSFAAAQAMDFNR